uniref:type II toxin-antitoxin system VapB family antitoxin n=1 Tax=Candidatus Electrothrix sp. TaxID=2170559 RepID=UPI004056A2AB
MRTNVLLDDELIREAVRLSGLTSENDAVAFALKELAMAKTLTLNSKTSSLFGRPQRHSSLSG